MQKLYPTKHALLISGLAVCVLANGCASSQPNSTAGEDPAELCDGSKELRLHARLDDALFEFARGNGVLSLYVNGECEFWVNNQSWYTMHGVLDEDAAKQLTADLGYAQLKSLQGEWHTQACSDPPRLLISNGRHSVTCFCDCENPNTPKEVQRINERFPDVVKELAKQGTIWDGPMDVLLVDDETQEDQNPIEWPSELDIRDYHTPWKTVQNAEPEDVTGVPAEGDDATVIRNLQQAYAKANPKREQLLGNPVPVLHEGKTFALYTRDQPPFSFKE